MQDRALTKPTLQVGGGGSAAAAASSSAAAAAAAVAARPMDVTVPHIAGFKQVCF
jgi:hypothetical protein